jgi:hypothetical protein
MSKSKSRRSKSGDGGRVEGSERESDEEKGGDSKGIKKV